MDEFPTLGQDELRRRILKYKGEVTTAYPPPGVRSDKIRLNDILLLAKVNNRKRFFDFLAARTRFGSVVSARLSRIVILLDAGRITKTQYGVYHFYKEPVSTVYREMSVNITPQGIRMGKAMSKQSSPSMPDFKDVFKGG